MANGNGCGTRERTSFANFSITKSRFSPAVVVFGCNSSKSVNVRYVSFCAKVTKKIKISFSFKIFFSYSDLLFALSCKPNISGVSLIGRLRT